MRRALGAVAVLAVGVVTLWSTDMFGWGKPKSSLTGEWAKAEEIALPWVKKNWNLKPKQVEADERWPYMLRFNPYQRVLVHKGQVDAREGIEALGAYLSDIRFLDRKDVTADLVLDIVGYFAAYPSKSTGRTYFRPGIHAPTELYPRLERGADGVKVIVHYNHQDQMPSGIGGSRPGGLYFLDRWTLTIPRDYKLSWKSEYVEVPRPPEYR